MDTQERTQFILDKMAQELGPEASDGETLDLLLEKYAELWEKHERLENAHIEEIRSYRETINSINGMTDLSYEVYIKKNPDGSELHIPL